MSGLPMCTTPRSCFAVGRDVQWPGLKRFAAPAVPGPAHLTRTLPWPTAQPSFAESLPLEEAAGQRNYPGSARWPQDTASRVPKPSPCRMGTGGSEEPRASGPSCRAGGEEELSELLGTFYPARAGVVLGKAATVSCCTGCSLGCCQQLPPSLGCSSLLLLHCSAHTWRLQKAKTLGLKGFIFFLEEPQFVALLYLNRECLALCKEQHKR